jgi:hypothetical protein
MALMVSAGAREAEGRQHKLTRVKCRTAKTKDIYMAKVKSHAKWNGFSKQQRGTLEEWLFEEKMGYTKAWERAKTELGFTGSLSSLTRFYKRTAEERMLAGFTESGRVMASVNKAPVEAEELRSSGMKVVTQVFFKLVTEKSEESKAWLPLAKLLAQREKNEAWRAVKDEENEIRKATLKFAQIRHQYDVMGQALKALPELEEVRQAQEEDEMTVYEKNKRLNDLRRRMFGEVIPDLLPENEEEEAHPEIIVRRYQDGQRRQQEQFAREYRERQREQAEEKARKGARKFSEGTREGEAEGKDEHNEGDGEGKGEGTFTEVNGGNRDEEERREDGIDTDGNEAKEGDKDEAVNSGQMTAELNLEQEQEHGNGMGVAQSAPETESVTQPMFVDEPRRLSAEERQGEYEELMRRARGC